MTYIYPKSPCCNATMYGVNKNDNGIINVDYIYCSKCLRHLDGAGKPIEPPRLHGDRSLVLAKEYQEFIYEFKEDGELSFWKVVWLFDSSPMRTVEIFHAIDVEEYVSTQQFGTSKVPTKWDSIDFVKASRAYIAKHSKP